MLISSRNQIVVYVSHLSSTVSPRPQLVESYAPQILHVSVNLLLLQRFRPEICHVAFRVHFLHGNLLGSNSCLQHKNNTSLIFPRTCLPMIPKAGLVPTFNSMASRCTPNSRAMLSVPMACCVAMHAGYSSASAEIIAITVWSLFQLLRKC